MKEDSRTTLDSDEPADDSYWAALFEMEESAPDDDPSELTAGALRRQMESLSDESHLRGTDIPDTSPAALGKFVDPWAEVEACLLHDRVLQLRVVGFNKGGLLVDWNDLPGFVPASQLIDFPQFHLPRERLNSLAGRLGCELDLKIIDADKAQNRLILSERAALVAADKKASLLGDVQAGERRRGVVTNLTDFGAFIDLGGVEGLVHKSEISWNRVQHPGDALQPGQEIEVFVLAVDPDDERIALSIKRLRPDQWRIAEERYKAGQRVRGIVGNVTLYGAFVLLEEGLEGLVHYSELADGAFLHPLDVVQPGEVVDARVLSVDSRRKRIALSLRDLNLDPE